MHVADELTSRAFRIGAVRLLTRFPNGPIQGDNFVGQAFTNGLRYIERLALHRERILIFGAGDTATALAYELGPYAETMDLVDLDPKRAASITRSIASAFQRLIPTGPHHAKPRDLRGYTLICHTAQRDNAGSSPIHDGDLLPSNAIFIDIAGDHESTFLAQGRRAGARLVTARSFTIASAALYCSSLLLRKVELSTVVAAHAATERAIA
jgi:shikimate 5-dehydrogenase